MRRIISVRRLGRERRKKRKREAYGVSGKREGIFPIAIGARSVFDSLSRKS